MFGTTFEPGGGGEGGAFDKIFPTVNVITPVANIDWQNIPTDYQHLKIIASVRTTSAGIAGGLVVRINNDAGNNYDWYGAFWNWNVVWGNGSAVNTNVPIMITTTNAGSPAGFFPSVEVVIPNYTSTIKHKSWVAPSYNPGGGILGQEYIYYFGGIWHNPVIAPINRLTFFDTGGGNIAIGSSLSLYGIR